MRLSTARCSRRKWDARQVMSVPTIYLNGAVFGQGRMGVEEIVAKLDTGAVEREAKRIAALETVRRAGGGRRPGRRPPPPSTRRARASATGRGRRAASAARCSTTMAIENFISVPYTEGPKLASAAGTAHVREYEVDILNLQKAEKLGARRRLRLRGAGQWRGAEGQERHPPPPAPAGGRGACPERTRIAPRAWPMPPLRRPPVQGQARGGDRRRQFRRGGGHRSCRCGGPCHPHRVRLPSCGPTRCFSASCTACRTWT